MELQLLFLFNGILAISLPANGQDFQLLVFGGYKFGKNVELFPSLYEKSCELENLPEIAKYKPYGGFMGDEIAVCAGNMDYCYKLSNQSGQMMWTKSCHLPLIEYSSLITTYDFKSWSFVSAYSHRGKLFKWTFGNGCFEECNIEIYEEIGACSARKNQTHAIISHGSKTVYWYEEKNMQFEKWAEGSQNVRQAGCGTVFHPDSGYQCWRETKYKRLPGTVGYDFETNTWLEGAALPKPWAHGASVPYQNSFLLIGGGHSINEITDLVLQYDFENGWIKLNITLQRPDENVGAMRVPKGMLKCPFKEA